MRVSPVFQLPTMASGYEHPVSVNLHTQSKKFIYGAGDEPLQGFIIQRGVGFGAFGEVYYATSIAGKDVALKRVHRNLDIELRGAGHCLNLRHPNLVELYDIRRDPQDNAWIVMEFVGGDSLRDVISRNPQGLSETVMRHWFRGIAAGVAYLHDNDVVHRDLKPANIFLDNGIVKIGDYGLSKLISTSRGSGHTESVGTFHYMAPEIGLGKYGRRIDIYSLGILLFEMLTGHVPFEGESSQEIIMKHLTTEANVSGIAEPYRSVVARALAKDPDRRYHTVDALLADLKWTPSYYVEPDRLQNLEGNVQRERRLADLPGGAEGITSPAQSPDAEGTRDGSTVTSGTGIRREEDGSGAIVVRPIVHAEAVPPNPSNPLSNEPIAQSLQAALFWFREEWNRANLNTPTKFLVLLLGVIFIGWGASWILPTAFTLGTIYAGYLVVWALLSPQDERPPVPSASLWSRDAQELTAPYHPSNSPVPLQYGTQVRLAREIFRRRRLTDRITELCGALLLSTFVVGVLSVLMLMVGSAGMTGEAGPVGGSIWSWAPTLAWMGLVSLVGTWSVLIAGKIYETERGDLVLRHFSMLALGMGLGVFAYYLSRWLLVEPLSGPLFRPAIGNRAILYDPQGGPRLLAAVGYFGILMLVLPWWQQADPLRGSRLSMVTTVGSVLTAILIHFVLPYPHGFLMVATMSMAIQISAPWLNLNQRQRLVAAGAPLIDPHSDS